MVRLLLICFLMCLVCQKTFSEVVYTRPPVDFVPKMTVSTCFCEKDGKVLLLLRNSNKLQGNTWCLPGGKILKRESPVKALIREIEKETGLGLAKEQLALFKKFYVRFPSGDFELYIFRADLGSVENISLNLEDNTEFKWVTLSEALELPLILGADTYVKLLAAKKFAD